jgi:phosphatidylserine decarboxylase
MQTSDLGLFLTRAYSSCVVAVKENSEVTKGQQIGYFQFDGSTHCLAFGKGVIS